MQDKLITIYLQNEADRTTIKTYLNDFCLILQTKGESTHAENVKVFIIWGINSFSTAPVGAATS